jgi:hypothetical protein
MLFSALPTDLGNRRADFHIPTAKAVNSVNAFPKTPVRKRWHFSSSAPKWGYPALTAYRRIAPGGGVSCLWNPNRFIAAFSRFPGENAGSSSPSGWSIWRIPRQSGYLLPGLPDLHVQPPERFNIRFVQVILHGNSSAHLGYWTVSRSRGNSRSWTWGPEASQSAISTVDDSFFIRLSF